MARRDAEPLGPAAPQRRRAELVEAILDLERREETLIEADPTIKRRSDASPLVVLGVCLASPTAQAA